MEQENISNNLQGRYEAILAVVPEIITEVDNSKVYTWMNQAGMDFFGKEAIGKEASFYFEGKQDTYNKVEPVFDGQIGIVYLESWQRRKDGEKRLLAWWCRTLKNDESQVIGALSSARDITEQKRIEDNLKASEKKFKTIFDNLTDGIILTDVETKKFDDANKSMCLMLGYTLEELKSLRVEDIHPKDKIAYVEGQLEKQSKNLFVSDADLPVVRKDGSIFYANVVGTKMNLIGKDYLVGIFRNVSERKKLEEELQKRLQEMEVFYKASIGREERIIELKKEVERLRGKQ